PQAPPDDATSRRTVLQLLGASAALASLGGCLKPPDEKILPYTRQPPEVTPGNPLHYASASVIDGRATGILVTANEDRREPGSSLQPRGPRTPRAERAAAALRSAAAEGRAARRPGPILARFF